MNDADLLADKAGLEEDLKAAEALASDSDEVAIWKLVSLLFVRVLRKLLVSVSKSNAMYASLSLTLRTFSRLAVVVKEQPRSENDFIKCLVRSRKI